MTLDKSLVSWVLSLIALGVATPLAADTAQPTIASEEGRRTIGRLPANLGRAAIGMFQEDNLLPFVLGGAATGVASIWDSRPPTWPRASSGSRGSTRTSTS